MSVRVAQGLTGLVLWLSLGASGDALPAPQTVPPPPFELPVHLDVTTPHGQALLQDGTIFVQRIAPTPGRRVRQAVPFAATERAYPLRPEPGYDWGDKFDITVERRGWLTLATARTVRPLQPFPGQATFDVDLEVEPTSVNWTTVGPLAVLACFVAGALLVRRGRVVPSVEPVVATPAPHQSQGQWDPEARQLLPADLCIGKYKVIGKLGAGGMAAVYKVAAPNGKLCALKIPNTKALSNAESLARFEREISICTQLIHPNIVRTLDFGSYRTESGDVVPYLVLDLVEGHTLASLLRDKIAASQAPDVALAVHVMDQVLSGLAFAHGKGIIHRDIKPSNLMMTELGVQIMDFGIAHAASMTTLTGAGILMGTPTHMAPEQIGNATELDARADVYAAGVTLYQLLTHWLPYESADDPPIDGQSRGAESTPGPTVLQVPPTDDAHGTLHQQRDPASWIPMAIAEGVQRAILPPVMLRKLQGPPVPPQALVRYLRPDLSDLAMAMLEVHRDKRCPSAEVALQRLRNVRL